MGRFRCAILDDYQNVAAAMADWSFISERVEVHTFSKHYDNEDELVNVIKDYEILVIMRERTAFGASVLSRLPRLKLLITTGMRNSSIDLTTASSQGVVVCGTESYPEPPTELTWALLLGIARNIVSEHNAIQANGPCKAQSVLIYMENS